MAGEAPYTTGQDILSYKGDAALGVGSGAAETPAKFDGQQLGGIISHLQDQEAHNHMLKYQQKLKQQEELAQSLAATDGSAFNIKDPRTGKDLSFTPLPEDQKILRQKADERRKIIMANPEGFKFDPKFLKVTEELNYLTKNAGIRAVHVADQQHEMTKADNEEDRQGYKEQIDKEVFGKRLDEFHRPEPYLPSIKTDLNKVYDNDKDLFETDKKVVDDNGVGYEVTTTKPNLTKLDIRSKLLTDKTARNNANAIVKQFIASPLAQDPKALAMQNQEILAANQRLGLTPENPHYIPPIPIDPNTGLMDPAYVNAPGSTTDLFYSLSAPAKAVVKTSRNLSDAGLKTKKLQGEIAAQPVELAYKEAQTDKMRAETEEKRKEIREGKTTKTKDLTPQQVANQHAAESTVKKVRQVFNPVNYPGTGTPINEEKEEGGAIGYSTVDGVPIGTILKDEGFNPTEWGVFANPKWGKTEEMIGAEEITTDENNKEHRGGRSKSAAKVFAIKNKKSGDIKLVYLKGEKQKDDKTKYNAIAIVDGTDAITNIVKHKHGYKESKEMSDEINRHQSAWDEEHESSKSPTKTESKSADNSEAAIMARLIPITVRRKDGSLQKLRKDPITGKRYAL